VIVKIRNDLQLLFLTAYYDIFVHDVYPLITDLEAMTEDEFASRFSEQAYFIMQSKGQDYKL